MATLRRTSAGLRRRTAYRGNLHARSQFRRWIYSHYAAPRTQWPLPLFATPRGARPTDDTRGLRHPGSRLVYHCSGGFCDSGRRFNRTSCVGGGRFRRSRHHEWPCTIKQLSPQRPLRCRHHRVDLPPVNGTTSSERIWGRMLRTPQRKPRHGHPGMSAFPVRKTPQTTDSQYPPFACTTWCWILRRVRFLERVLLATHRDVRIPNPGSTSLGILPRRPGQLAEASTMFNFGRRKSQPTSR